MRPAGIVALALGLAAGLLALVARADAPLPGRLADGGNGGWDGSTWSVTVTPDDAAKQAGARPFADTLTFRDGQFTTQTRAADGFGPVKYEVVSHHGLASFKATATSPTAGTMAWAGFHLGDRIKGEVTWTKADGTKLAYTFEGPRK